MKLTMKNNYSFQAAAGYPDDPGMMSVDDVKEELARWSRVIGSWMEGDEPSVDQIAGLDGFLSALATNEVEYEQPLEVYEYLAVFEYSDRFTVFAENDEKANAIARQMFEEYGKGMPSRIGDTMRTWKYLEIEPSGERLVE